jgi:hypothetical protein
MQKKKKKNNDVYLLSRIFYFLNPEAPVLGQPREIFSVQMSVAFATAATAADTTR